LLVFWFGLDKCQVPLKGEKVDKRETTSQTIKIIIIKKEYLVSQAGGLKEFEISIVMERWRGKGQNMD